MVLARMEVMFWYGPGDCEGVGCAAAAAGDVDVDGRWERRALMRAVR